MECSLASSIKESINSLCFSTAKKKTLFLNYGVNSFDFRVESGEMETAFREATNPEKMRHLFSLFSKDDDDDDDDDDDGVANGPANYRARRPCVVAVVVVAVAVIDSYCRLFIKQSGRERKRQHKTRSAPAGY